MMLALKGKLITQEEASAVISGSQGRFRDVVRALVEMGFERKEVERVTAQLASSLEDSPEAEKNCSKGRFLSCPLELEHESFNNR